MNEATQVLRKEHDAILRMLDATEQVTRSLAGGARIPAHILSNTIEFFRLFADRCHHGKEEELLFPALEKKGMPRSGGPIGVMLMEHDSGRALIAEMAEAAKAYESGDKEAGRKWANAATNYARLLRDHIAKENNILFVMAERLLTPTEQEELAVGFDAIEVEKMGEGTHERLHRMMDGLLAEVTTFSKT
jgi:hemerythrin-like domain-containing protein